jgi:tRNA U34 5-methylaminomethyl-2-thiouridine-forming methyltransferase MnmC
LNREIVISEDGSQTIFNTEWNEHYHSIHGAIQESKHIFIHEGLDRIEKKQLNILELGFGTGLNAILSFHYSVNKSIYYEAIELFPLEPEIYSKLQYAEQIDTGLQSVFLEMHESEWNLGKKICDNFILKKRIVDIKNFDSEKKFDLIYFDAFSPNSQPELWTSEIFTNIFQLMNQNALLLTYCSRGIVKRAMRETGLKVELLAGPPGKRHIVRARK